MEPVYFAAVSHSESSKSLEISCEKIYNQVVSGKQLLDIFRFSIDNLESFTDDEEENSVELEKFFIDKKNKFLSDAGIIEINKNELAQISKMVVKQQEESLVANLSETEKKVREEIKNFIVEYDLETPEQKQFLVGLRKDILSGKEIDFNYLQAKKGSENFNQEIIELMVDLAEKLQEKNLKVKEKHKVS